MSTKRPPVVLTGNSGLVLHETAKFYFEIFCDKTYAGYISLYGVHESGEVVFAVGYHIVKKYHKQGAATQALQLVVQWAFAELEVPRLVASVNKCNIASQKVLCRAGFNVKHVQRKIFRCEIRNPKVRREV